MSERITTHDNRAAIRWKLLTGASALALTAYVSSAAAARAEDANRPLIWLEVDGQFSRLQDSQEIYAPPFLALTPSIFARPDGAERPPLYSIDKGGSISFQPDDSGWIFSASIRYGRTGSDKHVRHQTYSPAYSKYVKSPKYLSYKPVYPIAARYTDVRSKQTESHAILDFQVGKDLGLGLFGRNGSLSLNAGIRIAQFRSKTAASLHENPDWHFVPHTYSTQYYGYNISWQQVFQPYHTFAGAFRAERSFHGIGPSLSWKSSVPFAGNPQNGELNFDFGVNGALLFGRQRTQTQHQTSAGYHKAVAKYNQLPAGVRNPVYQHGPYTHTRSRNVTVPNIGGSIAVSWKLQNFQMSLGYRADFFFNAIDGGIDAAKKEDRAFYGPYASISIGLGD